MNRAANLDVGSGRRLDDHAMQIIGSLLTTSRLSTVLPPSMTGVGTTQAIRQAFLAAWKSANADIQIRRSIQAERQLYGSVDNECWRIIPASLSIRCAAVQSGRFTLKPYELRGLLGFMELDPPKHWPLDGRLQSHLSRRNLRSG